MLDKTLLTDQNILDGIDAAGYGMNGWADRAVIDEDEKTYTVHVPFGPDGSREVHPLTFDQLREAFFKLLDLDQKYVASWCHNYFLDAYRNRDEDGLDMGYIDADAGEAWVQVAMYDEVIFG